MSSCISVSLNFYFSCNVYFTAYATIWIRQHSVIPKLNSQPMCQFRTLCSCASAENYTLAMDKLHYLSL